MWLIEYIRENYDQSKGLKELKDAAVEDFPVRFPLVKQKVNGVYETEEEMVKRGSLQPSVRERTFLSMIIVLMLSYIAPEKVDN